MERGKSWGRVGEEKEVRLCVILFGGGMNGCEGDRDNLGSMQIKG